MKAPKEIAEKVGQTCWFAWNRRSDSPPFRQFLFANGPTRKKTRLHEGKGDFTGGDRQLCSDVAQFNGGGGRIGRGWKPDLHGMGKRFSQRKPRFARSDGQFATGDSCFGEGWESDLREVRGKLDCAGITLAEGGTQKFQPRASSVGQPLSGLSLQTRRMKLLPSMNSWTVLMTFGAAKLMSDQKGRLELRGGSRADLVSAKEWISLFMHEAVLRVNGGND